MESAWKLPGASPSRPVADAMTPPCFTSTTPGSSRFNPAGAPVRLLTSFSLFTRADGGGGGDDTAVPLFDALATCSDPSFPAVWLHGQVVKPPSPELEPAAAAAAAAAALVAAEGGGGGGRGEGGVGLWVRSERVVGGDMDYTTTPATVWVRTEGAAYRLLAPAPAYARLYRPPGMTRTLTLTLTRTRTRTRTLTLTLNLTLTLTLTVTLTVTLALSLTQP